MSHYAIRWGYDVSTVIEQGAASDRLHLCSLRSQARFGLFASGGGFWEKTPGGRERAVQLLQAGLEGVRLGANGTQAPLTILHLPDGQDTAFVKNYLTELNTSARAWNIELKFDIIGLSYYPAHPWDKKAGYPGWEMTKLQASMNFIATKLQQRVMVVETDWPHRGEPENLTGTPQFPFTP